MDRLGSEPPSTPVSRFAAYEPRTPDRHPAPLLAATPGAPVVSSPAALSPQLQWKDLNYDSRRFWQGGHDPIPRASSDDRSMLALERRLDELWLSSAGKGKRLSEIVPNPGSPEVPVPAVLALLNALEAMREAVFAYAMGTPSLSLGEMQFLLQSFLRRHAGARWFQLVELCQREPRVTWSEVTKHACSLLNVRSREEWEGVLIAFTRLSGHRDLTLGEFVFRFRILAQASVLLSTPRDSVFLYELLLRGAQVPGLAYWAQTKARRERPDADFNSYATLAQGFAYLDMWENMDQSQRDESIKLEAQLSDKALGRLFRCLRGDACPDLAFLWGKDMREIAFQALEPGFCASVRQRVEQYRRPEQYRRATFLTQAVAAVDPEPSVSSVELIRHLESNPEFGLANGGECSDGASAATSACASTSATAPATQAGEADYDF